MRLSLEQRAQAVAHRRADGRAFDRRRQKAAARGRGYLAARSDGLHLAHGILVGVDVRECRGQLLRADCPHRLPVDGHLERAAASRKDQLGALRRAVRQTLDKARLKVRDRFRVGAARLQRVHQEGVRIRRRVFLRGARPLLVQCVLRLAIDLDGPSRSHLG